MMMPFDQEYLTRWNLFRKDFPHFYHATKWFLNTLSAQYTDSYKHFILKAFTKQTEETVEISVAFLITFQAFHRFAVNSPAAMMMIAQSYINVCIQDIFSWPYLVMIILLQQFNRIMKKSKIHIKWVLNCIDLTFYEEHFLTTDNYGQNITLNTNGNVKKMNDWFNSYAQDKDAHKKRSRNSDVTVVITHDLGSKSSFANAGGVQAMENVVFVKQEFAFQNFEVMHAIGHMIGCQTWVKSSFFGFKSQS